MNNIFIDSIYVIFNEKNAKGITKIKKLQTQKDVLLNKKLKRYILKFCSNMN